MMKFKVEQKGEKFIVFNDTTGMVRGVHKTKAEAEQQMKQLQKTHNEGIKMASGKMGAEKESKKEDMMDDDAE